MCTNYVANDCTLLGEQALIQAQISMHHGLFTDDRFHYSVLRLLNPMTIQDIIEWCSVVFVYILE